jgi:protein-disulfide isomerase
LGDDCRPLGHPNPTKAVVIYSDFQCPVCVRVTDASPDERHDVARAAAASTTYAL